MGCGDRFTVVIASDCNIKLPSLAIQNFKQKAFLQIKKKVKLLKEFAKKKEEINNRLEIRKIEEYDLKDIIQQNKLKNRYNQPLLIEMSENQQDSILDSVHSKQFSLNKFMTSNSLPKFPKMLTHQKSAEYLNISQRLLTEINQIKNPNTNQKYRINTEMSEINESKSFFATNVSKEKSFFYIFKLIFN